MATLVRHDSRPSWWWVSHVSPKNSKWLQENLSDMDTKVKAMIKLINEDADSFARRAEMYYKKRPELMKLVEEFYRAYRALAERYDQATGALRHAHRTISEAFPNQMPSMSDDSPSAYGQEMEPHTPDMSTFTRSSFDSDDQKDGVGVTPEHFTSKRNGTHPEETSALSSRKGLKLFNDLSSSAENVPRAGFDGKVRKGLTFESPEVKGKEDISNEMANLQQEVSRLLAESQNLKQQMLSESERADKAEKEIQILKETVLQLNSDKDTSLMQYNQSCEQISTLESELCKAQADLKKLTDEMAADVQKLINAETLNAAIQSKAEGLDQKMKMQQQELEQKLRELENFRLSFQEEHEKRMQAESALLSQGKELAQSHEEVQRLATEIKMANEKSNELKQTKEDLEKTVCELKKDVESLTEQNHSSEALMQKLRDEINALKDSKNELQSEIQSLKSTILQLETEKNAALLQHQQSVEQVSVLESQLSKLQSELEDTEQKVQLVTQHLEQKEEEVNSVHAQLQDECNRHTKTEATLLMTEGLHSQLQEKLITLTQDLDRSTNKLNELENSKLNLESTLKELKKTILDLNSEKDAALLQQEQSLEKASDLEAGLSKKQLELEKSEQKVQLLELEIAQKNECVDSLELSLKDECEKRLQAQKSLVSMEKLYSQSQEDVSKLHVEFEKQNAMLNELEDLSSELKNTILLLNTEKDAALHENQQSSVRISDLESELTALKAELEKVEGKVQILEQELRHKKEEADNLRINLQDEAQKRVEGEASLLMMTNLRSESQNEVDKLALEIEKLSGSLSKVENSKTDLENIVSNLESELTALKAELEKVEGKVQILEQELRHKKEEADNLRISLQDEAQKRVEGEASLLMMTNLRSESQNEVNKLALEIEKLSGSLSQVENSKTDLENIVTKHAEEIHILREQNLSTELMINDLHRELDELKESNVKLQTDIGLHIGEKETLHRDLASQMEEKENLEGIHHTLVDEMDALKTSAAINQKLIEQLQITNSKLKEVCAKNEIEKALLSEKVQEVEKLSEEYSLLENSLSDANAEMDALREKIKAFEASERSLNDVISCHVSEKAVLASELEILGKSLSDMSEKNSILDISLSDMKTELEDLRTKLKDSEESCQAHLANNSALSAETVALRERIKALETSESSLKDAISHHVSEKAVLLTELEILGKKLSEVSEKNSILDMSLCDVQTELEELRTKLKDSEESCQVHLTNNSALSAEKDNLFSQLESITMIMKTLEGKHANLEDKHSSVSREKDFAYDQVRELQDQLRIKNEECEDAVKSHQLQVDGYKKQISSLQEKIRYMEEMLQQEHQKNICASISTVILENSLADEQDKKVSLFTECQKHAEATQSAKMLVSELMDESRHHEEERKSLLMHNEKLREGISKQMKVLNICKDLGSADNEILLQTVSDETINVLKLKEEAEDVNGLVCIELSVLSTVLLQVGMELRDLHLQKCALEKEVESGAADLLSLQNKNHQMLEQNEQLRQGLRESSEREEVLKTEVFITQEKLSCLRESHRTSQDEISNLIDKNESLSKEYQSLSEKYNSLEDENGTILAECMMLENLCLFFRGHNNEIASALVSLTDEMALLSLARGDLDVEVNELSRKSMVLESENNHLKEYFIYMLEILRTRLVLSEFDLNTNKSVYQELAVQLENCMAQLVQKDDELQETEEKVQFLQEKNRELCGVVGSLQVAIEGAKVVKAELEKNIIGLTEQCTTKDDEILLLKQANAALQSELEQCDKEFLVLMGDAITYSVNSVVYEEKALKLMKEGKSTENSAIALKGLLMKEIYSRDAHIEELQKKLTGIQEEHAELKAELGRHLTLIASLADHVSVLEEGALSLSKPCTEGKEETAWVHHVQPGNDELESPCLPEGTPELQGLIARIEALQAVVLHAKDHQDQESAESAAKLAAANTEIQELKARGSSRMEAKEIFSEHEKPKDVEVTKGKQVQIMKDIELDRISYGTGAALYSLGPGANAELDDDMLQLWEAAERDCKNQTAKSSSSEHDIQAVEEVKSEHPSSELVMGRDLGINKLEVSKGAVEPHEVWSKNILERLASDAQRLLSIQASIEELKQKMEGPSKGKSPRNSEYSSVSAQLLETEGYVLEQINFNNKLTRKAENYPTFSGNMSTEREGYSSRRRISEQAQKGSENVARLELELQKMQYVLLKLEEEHEYRRFKVSDKRTRVLLRDYLNGRKDRGGGQKKKKRVPFCGCVRPKSRTEP